MTPDAFEKGAGFARTLVNFDNFTKENQLIPYRSNVVGDLGAATDMIGAFEYTNGQLYGLSYASGSSIKLFANTNFTTPSWGTVTSTTITASYDGSILKDYHGALYMSRTNQFDAYTYGAARLDTNISALSVQFTDAVVHSKDDTMYLASVNKVYANSSAVGANPPTATLALTLSADYTIASMAEYGDYLALLLTPVTLGKKAYLYLWSRSTTSRDGDTSVEIGNVQGLLLENLAGELVIVSQKATAQALTYSIYFHSYSGGVPQLFAQFDSSTSPVIGIGKQKINNRLNFPMALTWNGSYLSGIWQVSRTGVGQQFEVTLDKIISDTAITIAGGDGLKSFLQVGDYMFISYLTAGVFQMSKTDNQNNYTSTAIYESVINPNLPLVDQLTSKKLITVAAYFAPLSGSQQIVVKCRTDSTSTANWRTLFTKTATSPDTGLTMYEAPLRASNNVDDGVNYEFRVESTGGAILVGLAYKYENTLGNIA